MINRENNSRMEIASLIDKELQAAFSLKRILEDELIKQETMSERVIVRKDLRECNKKIKELVDISERENNE